MKGNKTFYTRTSDGRKFESYKEDENRIYLVSNDGEQAVLLKKNLAYDENTAELKLNKYGIGSRV